MAPPKTSAAQWPPTFTPDFHDDSSVKRMEYQKLGYTDIFASKLGLGGGPFGGLYHTCDQETVNQIVQEAVKHGINFLDTAYWYGQGRSEEALGKALKSIPRSAYYISTKVCRYEKDVRQMFDFTADRTRRQIDSALERLGLPYVDIINIHDVEFCENVETILNETLPVLQEAKDSGKARYIGITGYDLDVLKSIVEKSKIQIDVILTYSRAVLHDASLRYYTTFFKDHKVGIINAAPMSMGLLTNDGPPSWHPGSDRIKMACKAAAEYCKQRGVDISKLAAYESVNFPGVATTLVGMDSVPFVQRNLKATCGYLNQDERRCLNQVMDKYFLPLNDEDWVEKAIGWYKDAMKHGEDSTWT